MLSSQDYGFFSGHVWIWELDCEEHWAPKNWCFWIVMLEKTLKSPLDCKEIQTVHPKGDQSWMFIGRTDAKAETAVLWPPHTKSWPIGKDSDAGMDWGQEEKGKTEDEMAGWYHQLEGHEFGWILGVGDGQGVLACCDSCDRNESDMTERLNWTELNLPWFMGLTFQVPMQYCFLQHQTLLPSLVTSTTGCYFSLWLRLFILSGVISPVFSSSILDTYWPWEFITQCHIFLPFILFMGFSNQEYWSGLPFPSPVDHILSDLSTMTLPSWVAP